MGRNKGKWVWKSVVGYEGSYEVSDRGDVRSLTRIDSIGRKVKGRTLKTSIDRCGYKKVVLYKGGERKNHSLHRIIAKSFISNLENKSEVNHINGDKLDNTLKNLEWVTTTENMRHAFSTGLNRIHENHKGEKHSRSKLTNDQVLEIYKRVHEGEIQRVLAKEFKVSRQHISVIKLGKKWSFLTIENKERNEA